MADPTPPDYLVNPTFLGKSCGKGVNPVMAERLAMAETAISDYYESLAPEERIDPATGEGGASFAQWCGVREVHRGWRPGRSRHSAGAAIDVNYTSNPYIATRTGSVYGGESAGAGLTGVREAAVAVYDRAMTFVYGAGASADVAARRPGESTVEVWTRFNTVSAALASYLSLAFRTDKITVNRPPIPNAEDASTGQLDQIPQTELLAPEYAHSYISEVISQLPSWPLDTAETYYRVLRDYEIVRVPMVIGTPSRQPETTRNPARGFLDIRPEIVVALCDAGMRWGASDFDGGPSNGDMQHFDLADYGGYPPSG